jgi:hypothetical protein
MLMPPKIYRLCFNCTQGVLTDICHSFLRVAKVTEKIKTRSKSTPSENFNCHSLYLPGYIGANFLFATCGVK